MEGLRLSVVAFALNLVWETAQMWAYAGMSRISFRSLAICSAAAFVDGAYVLLLYWAGRIISGDQGWISRMAPLRLGAVMGVGFVAAVIMERVALFASLWQYARAMPRIPVVEVGLWPVLQLMTIPLVVFWFAAYWTRSDQR